MSRRWAITLAMAMLLGSQANVWGDLPVPNPVPQADGTFIWYAGNNTQYPFVQGAIDAANDGDEIVVTQGEYVESLEFARSDITLRPFCLSAAGAIGRARWANVIFINPTEGFNNANGYAIRMTESVNSYIGAPRPITQWPNGLTYPTTVLPNEYLAAPGALWVLSTDVTDYTRGRPPLAIGSPRRAAMTFQSRSIDNVAVYSTDGEGTFLECDFRTHTGYGGGVICTGDSNTTQFVNCNMNQCIATGSPLRLADGSLGPPVNVITIEGGAPQFIGCEIANNVGGQHTNGIILDVGSRTIWNSCIFVRNYAPACLGTYVCLGGVPRFNRCYFFNLVSWMGTVYWDSTGVVSPDYMTFNRCNFERCRTSDLVHGAVARVECNDCEGSPPRIMLSECGFRDNQNPNINPPFPTGPALPPGNLDGPNPVAGPKRSYWTVFDVWTPYYPMFRLGDDMTYAQRVNVPDIGNDVSPDVPLVGDIDGDGFVDLVDLELLHTALGTCPIDADFNGIIDLADILAVMGGYGGYCP